jgi:hypothetical protein
MKFQAPSLLVLVGSGLLVGALVASALGSHGWLVVGVCLSLAAFTAEGFIAVGLNRIGLALILAPMSACIALAVLNPTEPLLIPILMYVYFAGLAGIPAYFLFRKLGWLAFWQVVMGGSILGAIVSLLLLGGPPQEPLARGAALGALVATVFWTIAFARLPRREA